MGGSSFVPCFSEVGSFHMPPISALPFDNWPRKNINRSPPLQSPEIEWIDCFPKNILFPDVYVQLPWFGVVFSWFQIDPSTPRKWDHAVEDNKSSSEAVDIWELKILINYFMFHCGWKHRTFYGITIVFDNFPSFFFASQTGRLEPTHNTLNPQNNKTAVPSQFFPPHWDVKKGHT